MVDYSCEFELDILEVRREPDGTYICTAQCNDLQIVTEGRGEENSNAMKKAEEMAIDAIIGKIAYLKTKSWTIVTAEKIQPKKTVRVFRMRAPDNEKVFLTEIPTATEKMFGITSVEEQPDGSLKSMHGWRKVVHVSFDRLKIKELVAAKTNITKSANYST